MENELEYLAKNFKYKADKIDSYRILPLGDPQGDCDDYATTALYIASGKSLIKFWFLLITFQALMWRTYSPDGGTHLVLWVRGHGYIDNWQRKWTTRKQMKLLGYEFRYPNLFPIVAIKMLIGKVFG